MKLEDFNIIICDACKRLSTGCKCDKKFVLTITDYRVIKAAIDFAKHYRPTSSEKKELEKSDEVYFQLHQAVDSYKKYRKE